MTVGYSGTPLLKKLGMKPHTKLFLLNIPANYYDLLGELPEGVVVNEHDAEIDFVHFFTKSADELKAILPQLLNSIKRDGTIWVSWPKKASKVPTDVTEDTIREVALPIDLVDVKVCAVDEIWSGLKLYIRKEKR